MSTAYIADNGEFVTVAKNDCSKCHGTGIAMRYTPSKDGYYILCVAAFCDCIKITVKP